MVDASDHPRRDQHELRLDYISNRKTSNGWQRMMRFPPELFLGLGNEIMSRHGVGRRSDRRFRSTFGTTPALCSILWEKLEPWRTMPKGAQPKHLLWGLMLMKLYLNEHALAALAGGVDEKTISKWAWMFVAKIASLDSDVVSAKPFFPWKLMTHLSH